MILSDFKMYLYILILYAKMHFIVMNITQLRKYIIIRDTRVDPSVRIEILNHDYRQIQWQNCPAQDYDHKGEN